MIDETELLQAESILRKKEIDLLIKECSLHQFNDKLI